MSAVYEPREDSFFFEEFLRTNSNTITPESALEIGCGSGILTTIISKLAKTVVLATDINPEATTAARNLASEKGITNIDFLVSDLFEKIPNDRKFDLIVWNMPYVPSQDQDTTTSCGKIPSVLLEFFKQARKHLSRNGIILYLISSITPLKVQQVEALGYVVRVRAERKIDFETLTIFEAKRPQ